MRIRTNGKLGYRVDEYQDDGIQWTHRFGGWRDVFE